MEQNGQKLLVYPHQLEMVPQSDFEVTVLQSYYRGNFYLVEAKQKSTILYFESKQSFEKGAKVFLQIKK